MKKNSFRESKAANVLARVAEKALPGGFDWWLFTLTVIILAIGLIMVLSASGIVAEIDNGDKYYFFKRQVVFAIVGLLALWGAALMPRGRYEKSLIIGHVAAAGRPAEGMYTPP